MEVVFKVLMEKKRGTQVAPELINTKLAAHHMLGM